MEYIFNVKAQFEQKKEYNIEAQFEAIKKNIEGQVIHVQAKIDPNSLSLAKIQEQLKNEKLTLNIGNVTFDQSGVDKANKAVESVSKTVDETRNKVASLTNEYSKLYDTVQKSSSVVISNVKSNNIEMTQNKDGKWTFDKGDIQYTKENIQEIQKEIQSLAKEYEKFGTTSVKATYDANQQINGFILSIKDGATEVANLKYKLNNIINGEPIRVKPDANGNASSDGIGSVSPVLQLANYTIDENTISRLQQYNKELQNQEKTLQAIDKDYKNIITSSHEKNHPILGVDVDNAKGVISSNSLFGQQSQELQTQIENYKTAYTSLRTDIQEYQEQIKSGKTISQDELNSLRERTDAFKRLAETIRSMQYVPTQMESKSVINQKAIVGEELKAFETDVKNSNVATEELVQKINRVKENLAAVGDRNSFRTVYEDLRKLEAEFEQMQKVSQSNAQRESFGVDYTKASKSLDEVTKKIQELGSRESELTYNTNDLLSAFSNISDKYSLQTFNKMLALATKEVREQTQEVQNQEKEYQRLTDIVNKAYANATNTSTNSNAIQNVENIKLLRTQYDTVIEALNRLKNSTADTFEENKKAAQQAIQGFQDYSKVLQNSEQTIKATDEAIKKLEQNTQKGFFANNANDSNVAKLKQDIDGLRNTYTQLQSQFQSQGSTSQVTQGFATLDERIKRVSQTAIDLQQNLRQTNTELSLTGQKSNLNNRIETWLKNNTKATGNTVQALKQLQAQIQSADKVSLRNLTQQFRDITRNAELAGEAGKSFLDSINEKVGKFTSWFSISQIIMGITNEVKQAIVTFKEMDTILTEISKTSERSAESLAKLGESAFDTASKYGVSVQNYLTGVQEMARAGYETLGERQSEQMAELALLVQAAGGVSDSVARDYLIATDAAYQLGGSIEKLQQILDSQNMVNINALLYGNI